MTGISAEQAEQVLFTDKDGNRLGFQDVVSEGLDGGYEDRLPVLHELVRSGSPYHALLACAMLAAWGQPTGFQTIIAWATQPDSVPWAGDPVSYHRLSGADAAFETLADAVGTSSYADLDAATEQLRLAALRALLQQYTSFSFDRTLALAIIRNRLARELSGEMRDTFARGLSALGVQPQGTFDLAFQLASLLLALARADDHATAEYARQLLVARPHHSRMLRELTQALGDAAGPETLELLGELQAIVPLGVQPDVKAALKRRNEMSN